MRRLLIIVVALILIGGIGFFAYSQYKSRRFATPAPKQGSEATTDNTQAVIIDEPPTTSLDRAATPGISLVSDQEITSYWINSLDKQIYAATPEGEVIKIDPLLRAPQIISSTKISGAVVQAVPSPRGDAVLITTRSGGEREIKIFDLERRIWRALPSGTLAAAWNMSSLKNLEVAYTKKAPAQKDIPASYGLFIYSAAKGTSRLVQDSFNFADPVLYWTVPQEIYIAEPPSNETSAVFAYNINKKALRELIPSTPGLWTLWNTDRFGFLYSTKNGLLAVNEKAEPLLQLPLGATPHSCVRVGELYYCALPKTLPKKPLDPFAYLSMKQLSLSSFVSINRSGELTALWGPSTATGPFVDAVQITEQGDRLLFINRYDQKLYMLILK